MKKLFAIILMLVLLVFPFSARASIPSPDIKSLIHINPVIEFDFISQTKTNLDLNYWEPFMILKDYNPEIEWDNYSFDEALILYLNQKYETVEITFPFLYPEETYVYAVIVTEEEYTFVIPGIVTEIGSVIFDFSYLDSETCIMFIVSNHGVENG